MIFTVAIDGPAAAGKGTIGRAVAAAPSASRTSTPGSFTGRSASRR